MAGTVLAYFTAEVNTPRQLLRPLAVVTVVGTIVGLLSMKAGKYAVLVAALAAWLLIAANPWGILIGAGAALLIVVSRILEHPVELRQPVALAAMVFFTVGAIRALPLMLVPSTTALAGTSTDGAPMYLILLDGYPRVDGLADLGIDNQPFIADLEDRGFDHYPEAHSLHTSTHRTLTAMLTGRIGENRYGSVEERRAEQAEWRLPAGFVNVPPYAAQVAIHNARQIRPGGINGFDISVVGKSLLGNVPGIDKLLMDGRRKRLDKSLRIVATTDESRVFAHLLAPHPPFLYGEDGSAFPPPSCWPGCSAQWVVAGDATPPEEWLPGLAGTVRYLNSRLIETIDSIIARRPDAVIVLFSDHGGRLSLEDTDEWYQTLLVARTPEHPELFKNAPRPDMVLRLLTESG